MVPKRPRPLRSGLQELLERSRAIVLEVKVNVAKARWLCAKREMARRKLQRDLARHRQLSKSLT